jgi:predicted DNA-binding transcriptional regulator YafY
MRASRLVSLLLLLQVRGRMTAEQLADALEVSVRTIYRDMGALSEAGVPVYGDAGPDGGYQLVGGYRTRLTGLTGPEAQALALSGAPGAAAELGLGTVLAAAQLKLNAALPAELREQAQSFQERFHVDAPGWYHDGDPCPYLGAVATAVWEQRRIEVRYRRWAAPTDVSRTLEPHGLVLKAGRWYLVAVVAGQGGLRTFRVSQILSLAELDERFDRLTGFDLAAHWGSAVVGFRSRLQQGEATIRLSAAGRERLHELGSPVAAAVEATASRADERGWVTAVVPVESPAHAAAQFLSLGAEVEVLAPASLRAELARAARALALMYGAPAAAVDNEAV